MELTESLRESLKSGQTKPETRETQYSIQFESLMTQGLVPLGPTTSHLWRSDPKHLLFYLSRYKFVSKMTAHCKSALEIGCGDAFGSTLLNQNGTHVHCTDFDPLFVREAQGRELKNPLKTFEMVDFCNEIPKRHADGLIDRDARASYDAIYSLDVVEHIQASEEHRFLRNMIAPLKEDGIAVIGTPSLESQTYASVWSKAGHVNCKTGEDWRRTFERYFHNVLLFSMNDEVVHTGYSPMAHYLMIVATGVKPNA